MARNTCDDDLSNEFIALIAEETQSFPSLVGVLVQSLVAIVRDSRVWAWVIFHCAKQTKNIITFKWTTKTPSIKTSDVREETKRGLTDTLRAAVTPFRGTSVPPVAGDLAGALELITLITRETHDCPHSEARFGSHRARPVHYLSWIRTLLDCEEQSQIQVTQI